VTKGRIVSVAGAKAEEWVPIRPWLDGNDFHAAVDPRMGDRSRLGRDLPGSIYHPQFSTPLPSGKPERAYCK
jgi:hypothetical protein